MADNLRKGNLNPQSPDTIDQSYIDRARSLSLNFNSRAPDQFYQSFGFDDLRSTTGEVFSAGLSRGWNDAGGIDSLSRMRELNRAEDLTNLTPEQLDRKYNYDARGGTRRLGADRRPTLEEFGLKERPRLLQPDEANTKFGISGHLSWDQPVSSLVAEIQHKRKLVEVQQNSTFARAQGFVDNAIGFSSTLAASLVDPVGIAIGFIPFVGEAKYAKMGINSARFFRGMEAGLVGSLATEPINYAAKTQEKADYEMTDALMNITFGTLGGGGLFYTGGKLYDGYKHLRYGSNKLALEQAVKQLSSGADVEVNHLATKGAGPTKPIYVDTNSVSNPIGVSINARTPGAPNVEIPGAVRDFVPYVKPEKVEQQVAQKKSWLDFFSLKKKSPLDDAVEPIGRALTSNDLASVLKNPKLSEAITAANQSELPSKFGFYVRTADNQLMLVRPDKDAAARLLTMEKPLPGGAVDMASLTQDMSKLLSEHGLLASENFGISYKGSYKLDDAGITHVIELDNVKFDPEKNQKYTVFGPEQSIKNLMSEDVTAHVFTDLNPQGKDGVAAYYQHLGSFMDDNQAKYKNFAGYDSTIDLGELKQTDKQLGTNDGGVYRNKDTQALSYVKFQDTNHTMNEWLAATLYRWFQVPVPSTTIVTQKGADGVAATKGVSSSWVYGSKPISPDEFNALDDAIKQDFLKHFLVDAYLGNWDVVGNAPNWNMIKLPTGEVMRIDPGGALLYRAQGMEKGDQFGAKVVETQTITDPKKNPTGAAVFKNISIKDMDDAAFRILRVPQTEINKLIDTAVLHGLDANLGTRLKETLAKRRMDLEMAYKESAVKAAKEQGTVKFMNEQEAFDHLKTYTDELKQKLTKEELKVLHDYTGSFADTVNRKLWDQHTKGTPLTPDLQKQVDLLDSAFDKVSPLPEDILVWRGNVHHTTFNNVFKELGLNIGEFKGTNHPTPGPQAYSMIKHAEGSLIKFAGYTSTSFVTSGAQKFNGNSVSIMAQIQVPAGQKVLMAGAISGHVSEYEVVLPRNTELRVKQVIQGEHGGQPMVILQVVEAGSAQFTELSDAQALKIAKTYREKPMSAADDQPLWYEPKDSVADTLKGKIEDLDVVNKDVEALTLELEGHLANADPALSKAIKNELDATMKAIGEQEVMSEDMHKAAQAAALCITKGGG